MLNLDAIDTSAREARAAPSLIALATIVLLTGPSAGAALASPPDTKQMVLRLADLPARFSLSKGYYVDNARADKETSTATAALG